jgi:sulfate adenylyltransferase subunit 1
MTDKIDIHPSGKESGYPDMELLRFTTAGSVDDGKSTLIGRLLYDSKSIFEDQLQAIKVAGNRGEGGEGINLALLTDGLRAEREQGITIDVAYRYFATPKRKFIIADTPGHIEYTRNMVTGASSANVAIILVDARKGIVEQTKRHTYIASLLRIPNIILAINKMDLVDFSEYVYNTIRKEFEVIGSVLTLPKIHYIPISAKDGDNVVDISTRTSWYKGETLLHLLETIPVQHNENDLPARFPVQYVIHNHNLSKDDNPGYAGRVSAGSFKVGDTILVLRLNRVVQIKEIHEGDKQINVALTNQSVSIHLSENLDVYRGDMLVKLNEKFPKYSSTISMIICWLNSKPLQIGGNYIVRHTTDEAAAVVKSIRYKVNINTFENIEDDKTLILNEIAYLTIKTSKPLKYDDYSENRITGSLVLIDEITFETVGAGMIVSDPEIYSYNI